MNKYLEKVAVSYEYINKRIKNSTNADKLDAFSQRSKTRYESYLNKEDITGVRFKRYDASDNSKHRANQIRSNPKAAKFDAHMNNLGNKIARNPGKSAIAAGAVIGGSNLYAMYKRMNNGK